MAISYPVSFPSTQAPVAVTFRGRSVVGVQPSPLTLEQDVYAWPGDLWEADVDAPPMKRADAEVWVAFLLSLNGMEGSFTMGDPVNTSGQGTWAGTPLLVGAHAAAARTLSVDGFSAGATGKAGDWVGFGSSSTSRLHKVLVDFTANGSGQATIEIWPRLREAQSDNAALVKSSVKGLWRLASNTMEWSLERAQMYGLRFSCIEARG